MYTTSNAYKQAIKSGYLKSRVEVKVTPQGGVAFTLTNANIVPGSLSINNRATNSGQFSYGSVYVGAMGVTMIDVSDTIDRYSLFGAKVEVKFVQLLPNNQEEQIPMGVFYVNTPTRKNKTIALSCYDTMTNFDVPLTEATFGTPYELLSYLCTKCGVPMAQTEEEIEALPNGDVQFTFARYENMSARDALSNIAKMLCGFATIDRYGKLYIGQFHTSDDSELVPRSRTSSTIADYQTYFVAVTADMYVEGQKATLSALTGREEGLILSLGEIQIAQGTQSAMSNVLQTIADQLADVEYTPCQCEIISDASYDLGDMIQLSDVNHTTDDVHSVLTSIVWKYRGKMKIVSDGKNALLDAVKSSEAKAISEVMSNIESNLFGAKTYTNAKQFVIQSREKVIVRIAYSANKETTAIVIATIPVDFSLDGYAVFDVYKNMELLNSYKHYVPRGKSIVTISNYINSEESEPVTVRITMKCEYFESDKRIQDSQISGLIDAVESGEYAPAEIDTTVPSATIDVSGIRAVVFASGMNPTEAWDGNITIEEILEPIALPPENIRILSIDDIPNVLANSHHESASYSELIGAIGINTVNIGIAQMEESLVIGKFAFYWTISSSQANRYVYSRAYVTLANDEFSLNEAYSFLSAYDTIDNGALKVCNVETSTMDFASINGLSVVENGELPDTNTYKTLITDGTDLYSISGGALTSSVGLLANLSASVFQTYGFDYLADCTSAEADILALGDFAILRWCDSAQETISTITAIVSAIPNEQHIITPAFSFTDYNVTGIEEVTTDVSGNPQASIKFDNGNWEYYDTIDEGWYEVGQGSRGYMLVTDLENITEQMWATKLTGVSTFQTRFTLPTVADTLEEIQYKFLNE